MQKTEKVAILGGRFDGMRCTLSATPPRIQIDGDLHVRLDDPDTGEFLGGYVAASSIPPGSQPA